MINGVRRYRVVFSVCAMLLFVLCAGCVCGGPPDLVSSVRLATDLADNRLRFSVAPQAGPITKTFTLYNDGNIPIVVTQARVIGDRDARFVLDDTSIFPTTLKPGKANGIELDVRLRSGSFSSDVARLAFDVRATPDAPFFVELQKAVKRGQLHIDCATGLDFGEVGFGKKKTKGCEIRNVGDGDINISALVYNPSLGSRKAFQTRDVTFPILLKPEQSQTIFFVYSPKYDGGLTDAGAFRVESDLLLGPKETTPLIAVKAKTPIAPNASCLRLEPAILDFGTARLGCKRVERPVRLRNIGGPGCGAVQVSEVRSDTDAFTVLSGPSLPKRLLAGEVIEFSVAYQPTKVERSRGGLYVGTPRTSLTIPLLGVGSDDGEQQTDVFRQLKRPKADILWVIDNSSGMRSFQASLAKNLNACIRWLRRLSVDYQIMVINTDVSGKRHPAGCARGTTKIITPNTPEPIATFMQNANVGTLGSPNTQGLEAAKLALSPKMLNDPNCNKGFLHGLGGKWAKELLIFFVASKDDESPRVLEDYFRFFRNIYGIRQSHQIRASSITASSRCRSGARNDGAYFSRYWEFSRRLRGVQESLCFGSWAATLSYTGEVFFGFRRQFFLSRPADVESIQVKVNGRIIPRDRSDGWFYDGSNRSINFSNTTIPNSNGTIEVRYQVSCED